VAAHLRGSHPVTQQEDELQDGLMGHEPSIHTMVAEHPTVAETAPRLGLQVPRLLHMVCQMDLRLAQRLPVMAVAILGDLRRLHTNNHPPPTTTGRTSSLLTVGAQMLMMLQLPEHTSQHQLLRL
jgi:hypothetical protein